jgi:hypothetical protein
MNKITEKFGEGRKIVRRIYLNEMEQTWSDCVVKYGSQWELKNKKEDWITASKKPTFNTIWDEDEECWIEFEDWLEFHFPY